MDHIKIGDFGISKILSSKSKAFTVVGTPCYISPGNVWYFVINRYSRFSSLVYKFKK